MRNDSRNSPDSQGQQKQAGRTIPDKTRDCGPQVDTWPILDEQVGDASKPGTDEYGNRK